MSWENDQIVAYKLAKDRQAKQREEAARQQEIAAEELRLITEGASQMWADLQEAITKRRDSLNRESIAQGGREIFPAIECLPGSIRIVREDQAHLDCFFDSEKNAAFFHSNWCQSCDKTFRLKLTSDRRLYWRDSAERVIDRDDIATLLLGEFLKAEGEPMS